MESHRAAPCRRSGVAKANRWACRSPSGGPRWKAIGPRLARVPAQWSHKGEPLPFSEESKSDPWVLCGRGRRVADRLSRAARPTTECRCGSCCPEFPRNNRGIDLGCVRGSARHRCGGDTGCRAVQPRLRRHGDLQQRLRRHGDEQTTMAGGRVRRSRPLRVRASSSCSCLPSPSTSRSPLSVGALSEGSPSFTKLLSAFTGRAGLGFALHRPSSTLPTGRAGLGVALHRPSCTLPTGRAGLGFALHRPSSTLPTGGAGLGVALHRPSPTLPTGRRFAVHGNMVFFREGYTSAAGVLAHLGDAKAPLGRCCGYGRRGWPRSGGHGRLVDGSRSQS